MSTTAPTESELKAASSDLWQINDAIDKLDKLEAVIAEFATRRARAPEVDFPPSEISKYEDEAKNHLASLEHNLRKSRIASLPLTLSAPPPPRGAPAAFDAMSPLLILTHSGGKAMDRALRSGDTNAHNKAIMALDKTATFLKPT